MSRRRGRRSGTDERPSWWVWLWVAIAAVLVIGMALRHAPVRGQSAELVGSVATAAEPDAADEEAAWVEPLRRPDRRDAFLEAAGELTERWEESDEAQAVVGELLTMPQYSASVVWRFVARDLLRKDGAEAMRQAAEQFARFGGEGYAEGLRLELRAYIERNAEGATREHRRALEAIGEDELAVAEDAVVRVPAVEQHTLAQLVELLPEGLGGEYEQAMADMLDHMGGTTYDVYHPLDRAIGETHDYVALACARYLWDRPEHRPRTRRFLENRLDRSERYGQAIRQMLADLEAETDG